MDWPKIKTILITVLLVTNLMLGYTFFKEQQRFEEEKEDNLQDVVTLFENKGVEIKPSKLKFPKSIKSVNISFETFDMVQVDALLGSEYAYDGEKFTSGNRFVILDETRFIYSENDHYSRVSQDGLPSLTQFDPIDNQDEIDVLLMKSNEFMTRGGFNLKYDSVAVFQLGKYKLVKMYDFYNDYRFDESRTLIWFFEDDIVGFKKENDVNISSTPGSKYDIISIDRILYGLLPKLKADDVIKSISVIYKLNDESLLVTNLVLGEALPYYRIELESGEEFHIRAVLDF